MIPVLATILLFFALFFMSYAENSEKFYPIIVSIVLFIFSILLFAFSIVGIRNFSQLFKLFLMK
jgi:multidrug transporter EmrE-like cation transporter